jgi:hypothetical protein
MHICAYMHACLLFRYQHVNTRWLRRWDDIMRAPMYTHTCTYIPTYIPTYIHTCSTDTSTSQRDSSDGEEKMGVPFLKRDEAIGTRPPTRRGRPMEQVRRPNHHQGITCVCAYVCVCVYVRCMCARICVFVCVVPRVSSDKCVCLCMYWLTCWANLEDNLSCVCACVCM